MSNMGAIDPATYVVPDGQALLYTEVSGSETLYKYRFTSSSGASTTAVIDAAVVNALGVKTSELPMLVYKADLLACLNESFATVAQLTIAASSKASIDYVKKVAATKLGKADFLTKISQYPTLNELETGLSIKANADDVDDSLALKADKSNTYSKDEVNQLISTAVTNISITADQTTIVGDGTPNNPLAIASTIADKLLSLDATNHSHDNYSVLQKLSVDGSGNLLFDNMAIGGGTSSVPADVPIESITVNGSAVTVSDKNANIVITTDTVTGLANWMTETTAEITGLNGAWSSVMGEISGIQESVISLQSVAHTHTSENNFVYTDEAYACTQKVEAYKTFSPVTTVQVGYGTEATEVALADEGIETYSFVNARQNYYVLIGNGNAYLMRAAEKYFDNQFEKITDGLTNITYLSGSENTIVAIADGKLYTRAFVTNPSSPVDQAKLAVAGNMQGTDLTLSYSSWTQVGTKDNWVKVDSLTAAFGMLDSEGRLFVSGHHKGLMLGEAVRDLSWVDEMYAAGLINESVYNTTRTTIESGDYPKTSVLTTAQDGTTAQYGARPYLVNKPVEVTINGVTYTDWVDFGIGASFIAGMRGQVSNGVKTGTIYTWGSDHIGCLGNGVAWKQDFNTNAIAWVNGDDVIYTFTASPKIGTLAHAMTLERTNSLNGKLNLIGELTAASSGSVTVNDIVYTRDSSRDVIPSQLGEMTPQPVAVPTAFDADGKVTATTVVTDWFDMSCGWYHMGALRKNSNGETEVYLWGENEYGQLGTGSYIGETMSQSSLSEANSSRVEILSWPHKLTSSEFPYTDVKKVLCNHYGTFLIRENGDVYFAGCNKRNFLGTGTISDDAAFIPKFMKLAVKFNDGIYAQSYGALYLRKSPRVADNADVAVKAVLTGKLSAKNLDNAVVESHSHAIDTSVIDAAAITISQFGAKLPDAVIKAHSHANLSALNSLSVRNNVLHVNNNPVGSSSGNNSGTVLTVDPSNVMLDTYCDVAGMSNIAGGIPLSVIAYRELNDGLGAVLWVAPLGGVAQTIDRYVAIGTGSESAFTEIIPVDIQRKGLYAKPSNGTGILVTCTADLRTAIKTVLNSSSAVLRLYYVDPANASDFTAGDQPEGYAEISYSALKAGTLYCKTTNGHYVTLDTLDSVKLGNRQPEENKFEDVYDSNGTLLISKEQFETDGVVYYRGDGEAIADIGMLVLPSGQEEGENGETVYTYYNVYTDSSLTTVAISSETIKNGLRKKVGSTFVQIKVTDTPETWDTDTFEQSNGSIYIYPGKSSFVGMANQEYTFDPATAYYDEDANDNNTLKSVILVLNKAIETYEDNSSSTEFEPGSVESPMVAAIYSQNRSYTSTVNGEFNAAIGYNAQATGNLNNACGDFSFATGIANTVTGDISSVFGDNNSVVGDQVFCIGSSNKAAGVGNFVIGTSNMTHGHYAVAIGTRNETYGVDAFVVGSSNVAKGGNVIAVGTRNTMEEKARSSMAFGYNLKVKATEASVYGRNGVIERFEGNFPGEDTDALYSITADGYASAGYDAEGIANRGGFFVCAGETGGVDVVTDFTPLSFTKYLWQPNDAFFGAATGSSNRSSYEPYIFKPFYQWRFTGVMSMSFLTSTPKANDATSFTSSVRYGGRLKSCDPGLVVEAVPAIGTPYELDYRLATRWKFDNSHAASFICGKNFEDGAEASIVIYAGAEVYFDFDGGMAELPDDVNVFDAQIVSDCTGGDLTSVTAITEATANASIGFVVVKLMVVDNVILCQVIANTLA